jgi:5-(carboxyamino)imidazole ribonucleotide mutase
MPSGVAPLVVFDPENAALAATKIVAMSNLLLFDKIKEVQAKNRQQLIADDQELVNNH